MRHGFLWDKWHEYFDTKIVYEVADELAKERDGVTGQILAMIPHGIYPFGAALALVGKGDHAFHNARPVVVGLSRHNDCDRLILFVPGRRCDGCSNLWAFDSAHGCRESFSTGYQ